MLGVSAFHVTQPQSRRRKTTSQELIWFPMSYFQEQHREKSPSSFSVRGQSRRPTDDRRESLPPGVSVAVTRGKRPVGWTVHSPRHAGPATANAGRPQRWRRNPSSCQPPSPLGNGHFAESGPLHVELAEG